LAFDVLPEHASLARAARDAPDFNTTFTLQRARREKRRVDINIGLGYSAEVLNYQAFDGWFGTDKTGSDTLSHLAALKRAPKPCPFRMK
jgi:ABC-type dipeptide/oligopeptide/nickel transport system permease subunit